MKVDWSNVVLYHYTDFNAFDGIFFGKGLRLCDIHTMNDKKEMLYFLEMLEEEVCKRLVSETYEELIPRAKSLFERQRENRKKSTAFAACFSKLQNDAAQWERYGLSGKGISIGFKADKLQEIIKGIVILQPVFYTDNVVDHEHAELLTESIINDDIPQRDFDTIGGLFDNVYLCSTMFKHPAFKSEQEVRLVTLTSERGNLHGLGERNYLVMADRIKGYHNLNLRKLCKSKGTKITDIIETIVIGPKSGQSIEIFQDYLKRKGLEELAQKVIKSDCPLR